MRLCICLVFQEIYKLIQSCCCLHLQLIDSSYVEFVVMGNICYYRLFFVNFEFFVKFVFRHGLSKGEFVRS